MSIVSAIALGELEWIRSRNGHALWIVSVGAVGLARLEACTELLDRSCLG